MKKIVKLAAYVLPFMLLVAVLSSFRTAFDQQIKGNGVIKSENRNASPFTEISTSGVYKVVVQQGSTHSIKIEAEENLLPYILTEVRGDELEIKSRKGISINPTKPITVYVTLEKVKRLSASGASGFTSTGTLRSDKLELEFSGATNANLELNTGKVAVDLSGASNIELKGTSRSAEYGISGAADIAATDLRSDDVEIGISGTGKARVFAEKKLNVSVSGMGKVKYKGEPVVTQSISGMGKVSRM
ncbi:MAG TPA: head GIN domain-containing protein [Chitinophaga sp.]|uniref:head GIN domain-containing protein n=1 Tax=Chitinophaga sp. TaxID=1869181 RepID=UPI002BD015CE|nr:head GIN domain-containing protein [Chitinophaga sp.]HVI47356.1 head GIN domain-containing protein [Chitinophaga sp.]